jgi:ASC-1-like (ASCH) protein
MELNEKRIEGRLLDEKRSLINVGDVIQFTNLETKESLERKVIGLLHAATFYELVCCTGTQVWGYPADTDLQEFADSFYTIYTEENEQKYGVLGIYLERL